MNFIFLEKGQNGDIGDISRGNSTNPTSKCRYIASNIPQMGNRRAHDSKDQIGNKDPKRA